MHCLLGCNSAKRGEQRSEMQQSRVGVQAYPCASTRSARPASKASISLLTTSIALQSTMAHDRVKSSMCEAMNRMRLRHLLAQAVADKVHGVRVLVLVGDLIQLQPRCTAHTICVAIARTQTTMS